MGLGLRLRHDLKHPPGQGLHLVPLLHAVYDLADVPEVAVNMGMGVVMTMFVVVGVPVVMGMFVVVAVSVLMGMLVIVAVSVGVLVLMALQVHIKVEGVDLALFRPAKMEMVAVHMEALKGSLQALSVRPQIQKGPHRHISADSRVAFQI